MEKFSFCRVAARAVSFVVSLAAVSCVNSDYEISKENLDLNVTMFQEGVSLPLGSADKVTLGYLYSKLDDQTKEYLKSLDGDYGLYFSGRHDVTD